MNHLLAGFACLLFASVIFAYNPRECSKPSDCGPNECCVVGMDRYAIPQCAPKRKLSEHCREGAEPEDKVLYYPDSEFRFVENVWTLFCPCEEIYACHKNKCAKR
ncbi:hypothetical protein AVEN_252148-2 [Araneus ventricosus]|uniref:Prokineticin domain-containing protein n=1 Tax=Araneus ventricosus TaxID=182803 RepID=A0A4Y2L387_ARAVE|nr:hypothetical protein AVEN_252148-2 [Araneus ventricosus]